MSTHHRTVQHQPFEIRIFAQVFEQRPPNTFFLPAGKAFVDTVPRTKLSRQQTPGTAGSRYPKHGFDKPPGCRLLTNVKPLLSQKDLINPIPLIVMETRRRHKNLTTSMTNSALFQIIYVKCQQNLAKLLLRFHMLFFEGR